MTARSRALRTCPRAAAGSWRYRLDAGDDPDATGGASLAETLVAVALLGLLALLAVPSFSGTPALAQAAAVESDLRNAAVLVEVYRHEHGADDVRLVTTGAAGDAEVRVPRSEGVTVTGPVVLPGGGYCLAGGHEAVAPPGGALGDPVRWWDSDARRVVDEAPPGC